VSRASTYNYTVAGLTVRSDIELPELVTGRPEYAEPDVEVCLAAVAESLPQATHSSFEAEISQHEVLLKIPDVARYHVKDGRQILVEPAPGVQDKDLRLFLLGSALGALYFQRGYFPLHASVVVINGSAVAFSGDSGVGKSTMAAWMNAQGYPLLCDDVCVIRFGVNDIPMAYSAFPRLKLWDDALHAFAIDSSELQRDYFRADKYHLPAAGNFCIDPVPLGHINILQFSDDPSAPRMDNIKPAHAVHLLRDNTYRYQYISGLGLTRSHFLDCVRLAKSTHVHYLTRPRNHAALAETQRLIEQHMS